MKITEEQLKDGLQLFWAKGFDKVSNADILKAMGITEETFAKTYGTKANLYIQLLDFYVKHYWQRMIDKCRASDKPIEAIKDYFNEEVRILKEKEAPCGYIVAMPIDGLDCEIKEVVNKQESLLEDNYALFLSKLDEAKEQKKLGDMTDCAEIAKNLQKAFLEIAKQASTDTETRILHEYCKAAVEEIPVLG